jgi:hypothetical protein
MVGRDKEVSLNGIELMEWKMEEESVFLGPAMLVTILM